MIKKIPISAPYVACKDLLYSLRGVFSKDKYKKLLKQKIRAVYDPDYIYLLNSGIACFLVILESLKKISGKTEVIVPAYTAGSLVAAIKMSGLKAVLCDVSLRDFNLSLDSLPKLITENTLCIVGVHLFGMVDHNLNQIKEQFPNIYLVEDCAQSMGSKIDSRLVGNRGDVSFFSLNRGKNFSTYGGGIIITDNAKLGQCLKMTIIDRDIKRDSFLSNVIFFLKMFTLYLVVNPLVYGILYSLLCRFKEVAPPDEIKIADYTGLQSAAATIFFQRLDVMSEVRYNNGIKIINGLKGLDEIILPQILSSSKPAFNRLPLVFRNIKTRDQVEKNLSKAGIETSRMYIKPLHEMFKLGYIKEELPNAVYLAEHLLTLPTHPMLSKEDIDVIIDTIINTR